MKTLDHSRPLTAILAVGIARAAFEYAVQYAKERKQFGRPIADFQAIQFMLADMATSLNAARLLTLRSAKLLDDGKDASIESSMAKRFAADEAMKITTNAVQIYGGYGYTKEYPVEKLMRDAKLMQIYEGTSQIQRVVIAKGLLKE
ncbi:MAG: acyl-CoA dehydrogenase family protein [Bdellovibrionota bacterium]